MLKPKIELTREVAQAEVARRAALSKRKAECESDFLEFVRVFWRVLEPEKPLIEGWLLDLLCDTLMAITDGHLTRVVINVPPGSMKSSLLNVLWPAWEWGPQNMAHLRYLSVSYSTSVPERDNIRFARVVNDPMYKQFWGDRVKLIREGAEIVENNRTGWKRVTSTGGGVTGHRGDRILNDDLNNPLNVESDDVRDTTNRFVREIMPDRVNDLARSAIINLQQRTHESDATGTLIEYGQGYEFVCVPMEFDPLRMTPVTLRRDASGAATQVWRDPRGLGADGRVLDGLYTNARGEPRVRLGSAMAKAEGSLCWPERFPPDEVDRLRAIKGPYAWSSQFNQFPGVRGGSIIRKDWWKLWKDAELPEMGTILASLDTAVEEGTQNDYNALTVWGAFADPEDGSPQMILIEAWRQRMPLAELVARVAETCRRRRCDFLLIEHKTRGRDVHDEIARIYWDATWQTVLVKAETSKVSRLKAVEHLFSGDYRKDPVTGLEYWEGGMICAPDKEWADEVISEVSSFPYGAHDDYCFVAGTMIATRRGAVPIERVHPGDEVLTPVGWRPVLAAGLTGMAEVVSRAGLTGTAGHPVFTRGGYRPLGEADDVARLSLCGLIRTLPLSSSSSMASLIVGWAGSDDTICPSQRRTRAALARRACTSRCGGTGLAGRFRRVVKSTMSTATLLTLALTIWSAYRSVSIGRWLRSMVEARPFSRIWRRFVPWLPIGTGLMPAGNGIDLLPRLTWKRLARPESIDAPSAARLSWPGTSARGSAATLAARCSTIAATILPWATWPVSNAARCSRPRSGGERSIAALIAKRKASETRPVYNLTVADVGCYYANGVLVHNCDTVSQVLGYVRKNGVVLRKVEHDAAELAGKRYRKPVSTPYVIGRR